MGLVHKKKKLKKALCWKQTEKKKVYEEVAGVLSEPEALEGGYQPVDSGSDYKDHSEDGNSEDYGSRKEEVESGEGCSTKFDSDQGEGGATRVDSDQDESEDENSEEFKPSESGEGYPQEHKLPAFRASPPVPMGSALMSMASPSCGIQQLLSPTPSLSTFCAHTSISVSIECSMSPRIVCRSGFLQSAAAVAVVVSNGRPDGERREIRLGMPSKGRMADDTRGLLERCQLSVKQLNPRQYVAEIPQLPNLQDWFQRPKDIIRELVSGHLDIGIVGLDTVSEYGQGNKDLIIVHEALDYGHCRLSLAIPSYGTFEKINSVKELAQMPQWSEKKPLRVATGFTYLGHKFMKENGLKYVSFSTGDGALEAAPAMGTADVILDLVSSGTTLRENNLKEIEGGIVLESQAVLVASRKSLVQREGVRDATREILGRLEAHLKAVGQLMVAANVRGSSAEEVAKRALSPPLLSGLQGPTVSPVFCKRDGEVVADYYAIAICVPKMALYSSVQQLRAIGGSGVLISPLTYIFDEETPRWQQLLSNLGL